MVIRFYLVLAILLSFGCNTKNLYGISISNKETTQEDSSKIYFDGYYYCIFNYNNQNKPYIMSLLFYENNYVLQTDQSIYQDLKSYEEELLSSKFKSYFDNNRNRLLANYIIKEDSLITQKTHGGGTYAKHVETIVYEIINNDTIRLDKTYALDKISRDSKIFVFKKFNEKPPLSYWKTN